MNMRKMLTVIAILIGNVAVWGSDPVSILISDGIDNDAVKAKMERTMSTLFTEANAAWEGKRNMNYAALGILSDTQDDLSILWENSPFICYEPTVVQHCLTTGTGYQIRNIPLELVESEEDDKYHEAVLNFDKRGNLVSFHLSISNNLYMEVLNSNLELTDLRRRQLILDWVEQFRTAYNKKDSVFLEAVYSDDALIITGKVTPQRSKENIKLPPKIEYKKQTKRQYLNKLKEVFRRNKTIRVTFDEIEVTMHPVTADVYGVTLHQGYTSDTYHDDGYLFLLWDFQDESRPLIHVRTWQPDSYGKDGKTKQRIPKNEIFGIDDFPFDIPT